jgi:hypothetical protein
MELDGSGLLRQRQPFCGKYGTIAGFLLARRKSGVRHMHSSTGEKPAH